VGYFKSVIFCVWLVQVTRGPKDTTDDRTITKKKSKAEVDEGLSRGFKMGGNMSSSLSAIGRVVAILEDILVRIIVRVRRSRSRAPIRLVTLGGDGGGHRVVTGERQLEVLTGLTGFRRVEAIAVT
jgi:hypothetical protein